MGRDEREFIIGILFLIYSEVVQVESMGLILAVVGIVYCGLSIYHGIKDDEQQT